MESVNSLWSEIFTNHGILMDQLSIFLFYSIQIAFEFINALLFAALQVLEDFPLGIEFTFKIALLCFTLIDWVLEFLILLRVHVGLSLAGLKFYLSILGCQDLVLQFALYLQQVGIG